MKTKWNILRDNKGEYKIAYQMKLEITWKN